MKRIVRDMALGDVDSVARYFVDADTDFLRKMGVDEAKVPPLETWREMLVSGLDQPYDRRIFHFVIWEMDGRSVGHSNVNKLTFGKEAWMHLHLWTPEVRRQGYGTALLRDTVALYFRIFELEHLHCQPYALNPAPNHVLPKVGFEFKGSETTIPGMLNFEQEVNMWSLSRERWLGMVL